VKPAAKFKFEEGYQSEDIVVNSSGIGWEVSRQSSDGRYGWNLFKLKNKPDAIKLAKSLAHVTGLKYVGVNR